LHFLAHYRHGYTIEESLNDITPPLTTGNITTIGAFLSLLFISSESMHDFGWFASLLLLGTILFVLIFLPHLLPNRKQSMVKDEKLVFKKLAAFSPENNKWIVGLICVLSFVFFFLSKHTTFETDMHKINYMTESQTQQMEKLNRALNQQKHTMYCVSEGKTLEEALENYEKTSLAIDSLMQKDTFILKKSCLGIYLPSPAMQAKRIALWNTFWQNRKDSVLQYLATESKSLGYRQTAFAGFESVLQNEYQIQTTRYFSPVIDAFAGNFMGDEDERAMIFTVLLTDPEHRSRLESSLNAINVIVFGFDRALLPPKW
jgi:predicted exporter